MSAYIFADLDVHDWDNFQRYREQMPASVAATQRSRRATSASSA